MKEVALKYREIMSVSQIHTASPFNDYNKVDQVILKAIEENMRRDGYDISSPIVLWDKGNIVIDGHTRLQAAINVGLKEVDVCMGDFVDENDAMNYAKQNQRDRRNLPDALILELVIESADNRMKRGGDHKSAEFKSQNNEKDLLILDKDIKDLERKTGNKPAYFQDAEAIGRGVTPYKVQQARIILDSRDDELIKEVLDGKKTFVEAVKGIKAKLPKKIKSPRRLSRRQLISVANKMIDDYLYAGKSGPEIEQTIKDLLKQKSEALSPKEQNE